MHHKKWTPEKDKRLIQLVKEFKYTISEIAKKLNKTERAVNERLYYLCIPERPIPSPYRKWTKDELNLLVDLYRQGVSVSRIAKKLNRTESAIYIKITRLQLHKKFFKGI